MRKLWYFGLEPLMERYTWQLSEEWMPSSFQEYKDIEFIQVRGVQTEGSIKVGTVLDAYGRGVYAMSQCQSMLLSIAEGKVSDNDIIFLQDFWTPGIEAVFYMLDLYKIKVKLYSMLHAQSVDEYDFTYDMRKWMRHFELGIAERHDGIFVGSTIHRLQLREAGVKVPIHVVSLPINQEMVLNFGYSEDILIKEKQVIYTSRLDKEKNPYFLLEVAEYFLKSRPDYKFVFTTSGKDFRSNVDGFVKDLYKASGRNSRIVLKRNLTKKEYYEELQRSDVQFNTSLQDYVSWTLLESTLFGCDICYPNYRSFTEILPDDRMYKPFYVTDAIQTLLRVINDRRTHKYICDRSDLGRRLEAYIVANDITTEYNIWHEESLIKKMLS